MPDSRRSRVATRKFGAAALDLRREIEPDRFRIGRRLREPLAAQPGGELPPVGGVGALGVVGLGGAGVGLGGLRQAGQPAAEPAGRQEQGRGGCAPCRGLWRIVRRLGDLSTRLFSAAFRSASMAPSGPKFRTFRMGLVPLPNHVR